MGWTSLYRPKGTPDRDFFQNEVCGPNLTIIEAGSVAGTFYGAVRNKQTGEVFAMVALQQRKSISKSGGHNYAYKAMAEDEGPFESCCPQRVLDALTPTGNEYAQDWRARCAAYNNKVKPTKGDTVLFAEPIRFTDGTEMDAFRYATGFGNTFESLTSKQRYNIRGWRDREYVVLGREVVV
jgi:hypothetical protein